MSFLSWMNPTPISAWPFSWSNQLQSIGKVPTSDSDLPDAVIIEECQTTMQEAYAQREFEGPLCAQSKKRPYIACCRGTTDGPGWVSNIMRGAAWKNEKWGEEVEEIKQFLAMHPEITDIIGHSRGGPQCIEAAYYNPKVRVVQVDGASILASGITAYTRNINTNSSADTFLQGAFGVNEKNHPWGNMSKEELGPSGRAGHQVWAEGVDYLGRYAKKESPQMRTGFWHGKIQTEPTVNRADNIVQYGDQPGIF